MSIHNRELTIQSVGDDAAAAARSQLQTRLRTSGASLVRQRLSITPGGATLQATVSGPEQQVAAAGHPLFSVLMQDLLTRFDG